MPTLLTSTGYGNTGSSAATNLLEEFESIKSFGNAEFTFAHEPDGIADLENSLLEGHRFKVDLAIKRFIKLSKNISTNNNYINFFNDKFEKYAEEYINSIISCEWDGWWHRIDETEIISKKQKKFIQILSELYPLYLNEKIFYKLYEPDNWHPTYCPLSKEYYANLHSLKSKNDFLIKTKNFTDKLLLETCINEYKYKFVLLDQAIPPISFSQYLRYFTSPKVIIVDRDPRDLYVMNKAFWGGGYIPTIDIHLFIKWYSKIRQSRKNEITDLEKINNGEILLIKFESLIYEYDDSIKKIMNYTGLSVTEHINKLKYFNPELSIKNTQIFINYPELQNDIKLIESNLEEYCYNFPYKKSIIDNKNDKSIFIDEINKNFNKMKNDLKLSKKVKKYNNISIFKITKFYIDIHTKNKKRNIISFIKLSIKFILCPIEILLYKFQYK
jgi:hypothetical protein